MFKNLTESANLEEDTGLMFRELFGAHAKIISKTGNIISVLQKNIAHKEYADS